MENLNRRWNHNIHYHRLIVDAVPAGAKSVLDVGCGNGLLAMELRNVVPDVMGIDVDGMCSTMPVNAARRSPGCRAM